MTPQKLKEKIKKKFKTLTDFSAITGLDRMEIQKAFMPFYEKHSHYIEFRQRMDKACDEFEAVDLNSASNAEKIERLKTALNDVGGPDAFLKLNPGFLKSRDTIFKIISGKRGIKGPVAKKILDHFKIE